MDDDEKQTTQNTAKKLGLPYGSVISVASYDTRPGNEMGLFYNTYSEPAHTESNHPYPLHC